MTSDESDIRFGLDFQKLQAEAMQCRRCRLCETRKTVVFGEGNPSARIMFIGEGPGKTEDETGRPFVGRAGELLTRIIENGMGLRRSDVYIANVVKCRPTLEQKGIRDRPPDPEETAACSPFLIRQIELISPEVIVTLGNPSTRFLLQTALGITKLRGKWADFRGIPLMPTYHPSYVLRNGGEKSPLRRDVWQDIQMVMDRLGLPRPQN
ncbi:MAG: uracil-DNA glycosylase [Leptospiraceae bacterium]|nr:uracil-DNA glycosylase [Leptospiraceae bacterium]